MMDNQNKYPAVYFKSLILRNIKCFKGDNVLDLSENEKEPALWTVILGNNGTGKTTLLKFLGEKSFKIKNSRFELSNQHSEYFFDDIVGEIEKKIYWEFFFNEFHFPLLIETIKYGWHYIVGDGRNEFLKNYPNFELPLYAYGASRKLGESELTSENGNDAQSNLLENKPLINAEEWLMQTDYKAKNGVEGATEQLEKITKVLIDILPDVHNFHFRSTVEKNFVECETDYGNVPFKELSYGYHTMTAWIVDFARRQFLKYPKSENPLAEPAIVLVDEIDLHLHPEWQRKIIAFLSRHFPKTQFIVTAHSPLIVQSAEKVNVVLLQKEGDRVTITNRVNTSFQGWTVDEILSDLMGLEKTVSDVYLQHLRDFEEAVSEDNSEKAKTAYDALDKILHPSNHTRKILRIQMAGLTANADL